MALARIKNWIAGDILLAADLNAEFNNVLNNAVSLISPLTSSLDFSNQQALNLKLETQVATQSASVAGRIYYQTTENLIHVDTGSIIQRVASVAGLQLGDILYANQVGSPLATDYTRLGIGSPYAMLGVNAAGAAPRYRDLIAGANIGLTFADGSITFSTSPVFTTAFTSTNQTITGSSTLNVAHGLGARPKLVRVTIKNTTAELGYAQNDEVEFNNGNSTTSAGMNTVSDATNVTIVTQSTMGVLNKSTQASANITFTNWVYIVRAWV